MKRTLLLFLCLLFSASVFAQDTIQTARQVSVLVSNASSTGTTRYRLAKLTGAPSKALIAATTDTDGVIGIVTAGAGIAGTATVQTSGQALCMFDGATTAGDYVQISSSTAGKCHDTGAGTYPTSGQVLGRVLSTNVGAGTYYVLLSPGGKGSAGGTVTTSGSPASPQLAKFSSATAITGATATDVSTPVQCADAGASDTYACNLAPAPASYVVGTHLRFFANTANTGAASVNFNSLGALTVVKVAGGITTALSDNDIRVGQWVDGVIAAGSNFQIQSTLGNAGGGGITNGAGANVVPKSNGTNLVASQITDNGTAILIGDGGAGSTLSIETETAGVQVGVTSGAIEFSGETFDGSTFTTVNLGTVTTLALDNTAETAMLRAETVSIDSGVGSTSIGDVNTAGGGTKLTIDDATTTATLVGALRLTPVAFASLPGTPTEGMVAWINDSDTVVWGATITGGDTNKVLAVYNGTNWTVAGASDIAAFYKSGTPGIAGNATLNTGSKDSAGKITSTGTGASTAVLTFSSAFTRAPACFVMNETTANLVRATSTTTTLTINATVVTGDSLSYICIGY